MSPRLAPNCVVPTCPGKDSSDVKLFRFPDADMAEWCANLRLDVNKMQWHWRVCNRHFDPDCIGAKKLKDGALPTEWLGHNEEIIIPTLRRSVPLHIIRCMVPHCRSTGPLCVMHRVPESKRQNWLHRCGMVDPKPGRTLHICSLHFAPCFRGRKNLRRNAEPTLNLECEKNQQIERQKTPSVVGDSDSETYSGDKMSDFEVSDSSEEPTDLYEQHNLEEPPECNKCEKFAASMRFFISRCAQLQRTIDQLTKEKQKLTEQANAIKFLIKRMSAKQMAQRAQKAQKAQAEKAEKAKKVALLVVKSKQNKSTERTQKPSNNKRPVTASVNACPR